MSAKIELTQDEKVLAAVAHGSILIGFFTSGFGGLITALVIWLVQRGRSAYVARQAVQALIYQGITFVVTMLAWCCWGAVWMGLILIPILQDPYAYNETPPAGLWVGLGLMLVPLAIWGLTIVYGLYGAIRCLRGHEFRYALIGRWSEKL